MIGPEKLERLNVHPDTLKRFDDLIASKGPKAGRFHIPVTAQAMLLIGYVIVQWGNLQHTIDFEIVRLPPDPAGKPIRHETKYKVGHLRAVAPRYLADARPNALQLYLRNLDQIERHKGIRDALAHGSYSVVDNEGFPGAVVQYKAHKIRLPYQTMQKVGDEIGQSTAFLFNFWDWVHAEQGRAVTESLLRRLLERAREHRDPETPDTP
jgi:hypothetical protein